jgi:DNA transformation protein and related proteins
MFMTGREEGIPFFCPPRLSVVRSPAVDHRPMMRNIGPKSRKLLEEVDIFSLEDLAELGSVEAYARLRFRFGRQVNRNMLHALDAALAGCLWTDLSAERKAELDAAVAARMAPIAAPTLPAD